jgi:hypothetical protein
LPQRAFADTLTEDGGEAAATAAGETVELLIVEEVALVEEAALEDETALHVPKALLQPVPQYVVDEPQ